jgi:chromosome segregation ATPase
MLVTLGFLLATLLALALAPAFRRRIERLTIERLRASMPLTEAEIKADKDRLRAQFAIRVHKLEQEIEKFRMAAARQLVDINRRDATIAALESEAQRLRAEHEENLNARRVLEHTISDRVPKIEQRLSEARKLVQQRDQEKASLSSEATRSIRALDDAMQANAQQRSELDRLQAALGGRSGVRPGDRSADARIGLLPTDLTTAREAASAVHAAEAQVIALKSKVDDQATEINRLKASLSAYEADQEAGGKKAASKARLYALQAEVASQTETIQRLRADLAASNERLARNSAHYMEEMRRLGAGALAPSAQTRRPGPVGQRRTLAERIGHSGPAVAAVEPGTREGNGTTGAPAADRGKVTEFLRTLSDRGSPDASVQSGATDKSGADSMKSKPRLMDRLTGLGKN